MLAFLRHRVAETTAAFESMEAIAHEYEEELDRFEVTVAEALDEHRFADLDDHHAQRARNILMEV